MATSDKYDRQLRLWGANGQRALSNCHIVLINASAVGTETLKNLVLPGVGSFHIVDDEIIQPYSNSGNIPRQFSNFFATPDPNNPIPRASATCSQLSELNDDVKGSCEHVASLKDLDYDTLLEKQKPLLVIAADLPLGPLSKLARSCWSRKIYLISVKSYGLIGIVRVQTPHHEIIEAKPDNAVPDLRLANFDPLFPELQALVDKVDLESLSDMEHAHVPYVIILCKVLEKWRENSDKRFPTSFVEKNDFKALVKATARNFWEETNFEEAHKDAYLAYAKQEIPFETMQLIEDSDTNEITTTFDIMLRALKKFMKDNNSEPPLNGSIPDMTSTTKSYIALQQAYQMKSSQDLNLMRKHVDSICSALPGANMVSDEDLATFCKNIFNIELLKTRSLEEEIQSQTSNEEDTSTLGDSKFDEIRDELMMTLMEQTTVDAPLLWYIAVRACELFELEHGMFPGEDSRQLALDADTEAVHAKMKQIVSSMGMNDCDLIREHLIEGKNIAKEVVRYFNAELHNIGSVVGGIASQEAVKLITKQYIPLNNTFVFNGITSSAGTYQV